VAAAALVDEDALDGAADERLHVRNHRCQRMAIIWIDGQPFYVDDDPAALPVLEGATLTLTPNS
jgi:hypothetical protein